MLATWPSPAHMLHWRARRSTPMAKRPRLSMIMLTLITVLAACSRPARETPPANTPGAAVAGATSVEELVSSGELRRYRLHVPAGYDGARPLPLVVNLHGYGSNGAQQEQASQMSVKADSA